MPFRLYVIRYDQFCRCRRHDCLAGATFSDYFARVSFCVSRTPPTTRALPSNYQGFLFTSAFATTVLCFVQVHRADPYLYHGRWLSFEACTVRRTFWPCSTIGRNTLMPGMDWVPHPLIMRCWRRGGYEQHGGQWQIASSCNASQPPPRDLVCQVDLSIDLDGNEDFEIAKEAALQPPH